MTHSQSGHLFYCITVGPRTLCYDCNTKRWHDRSSSTDGSLRWRPNAYAQQIRVFGDALSGDLLTPVPGGMTESGISVLRQFITPQIFAGTYRAFCSRLEIEMEVGTAAQGGSVAVEWSDDGGTTWSATRTMSTGALGALRHRVYTTRLGSFRQRVFRVTASGAPTFYAIDADMSGGTAG